MIRDHENDRQTDRTPLRIIDAVSELTSSVFSGYFSDS